MQEQQQMLSVPSAAADEDRIAQMTFSAGNKNIDDHLQSQHDSFA